MTRRTAFLPHGPGKLELYMTMKNTYVAGTPGVTDAIGRYANVLLDDWYSKTFPRDSLFFIFF